VTLRLLLVLPLSLCLLVTSSVSYGEDSSPQRAWQHGGFLDISYPLNFNFPDNHRWRSKQTTPRTNELTPNMGFVYLEKDPTRESRWGLELALQAGYDTDDLVPRQDAIHGADTLRHLARASVSYLAPAGNGLLLTAGLFRGFRTYESFYAKYNFNYTRTYLTDINPNFLIGAGATYPVTSSFEVGAYVVNEYQYLAHSNDLPSYVATAEWRAAKRLTFYSSVYYGPDQEMTAVKFWRVFSDSTVEWHGRDRTVAVSYDVGSERLAGQPDAPRTYWMGSALFTQWRITGPWSLAIRPECFWDRNGRMTQFEQFIWANTTTLTYKRHSGAQFAIFRIEHRYDHSTGEEGGFFHDGLTPLGQTKLTTGQHLVLLSVVWALDL
jgi:hypothetical protein